MFTHWFISKWGVFNCDCKEEQMQTLSSKWMIMGTRLASMTACTCCWFPAVMLDRNHTASCRTKSAQCKTSGWFFFWQIKKKQVSVTPKVVPIQYFHFWRNTDMSALNTSRYRYQTDISKLQQQITALSLLILYCWVLEKLYQVISLREW